MIDLHVHSCFSDGSLFPDQICRDAAAAGITTLALTDHDTTAGLDAFAQACDASGIRGIPGLEISAEWSGGTMHLLGYFIDRQNPALQAALQQIRNGRHQRNLRIVDRLCELGHPVTLDEVQRCAGDAVMGRPHFAQALIASGAVRDKEEAFRRLLGKGCPAYVDRFRLTPEQSICLIHGAGGLAVLAHPGTLGVHASALRSLFRKLKAAGLDGVETYYSEHSSALQALYGGWCRELGLLQTGGSDFHGAMNPAVQLGSGFGHLCVPDELAEMLFATMALSRDSGVAPVEDMR